MTSIFFLKGTKTKMAKDVQPILEISRKWWVKAQQNAPQQRFGWWSHEHSHDFTKASQNGFLLRRVLVLLDLRQDLLFQFPPPAQHPAHLGHVGYCGFILWWVAGSKLQSLPLFTHPFQIALQKSNHLNWFIKHGTNNVEAAVSSPAPLFMRAFFTLPVGIGISFGNGLTKHLLAASTAELAIAGFLATNQVMITWCENFKWSQNTWIFGGFPRISRMISKQSIPNFIRTRTPTSNA